MKSDFVDLLGLFQLDGRFVDVRPLAGSPGEIDISIKGPWLHTILFEVPLLAIVNEVWFRHQPLADEAEGLRRLEAKIARLRTVPDCTISDFGTRRRYSRHWQARILPRLRDALGPQFAGTSNVFFAREYDLVPHGTMAHEFLQAFQALGPRLVDSQKAAFEAWAQEYRGDLGVALSDVVGIEAFLRDFDLYLCKLFDGIRHDSGDPFAWGERVIAHLRSLRIDPRAKTLVFSDSLDVDRVLRLHAHFRDRCKVAFGVGTNLTNDLGPTPLNIVMKMVRCNGQPVAKVSDAPGKGMCDDPGYLAYLRQVFGLPADDPQGAAT
jgi:nicotinate phosphoribosyltransferase